MEHDKGNSDKIRICIIGAGFSGLCAAIQLQRKLKTKNFTIFDQNSDVGGTWFVNTYPGCLCDIPAHLYSFSFEPKSDWSSVYPTQGEIFDYLRGVAKKYSLYPHIRFRRMVKRLCWEEFHQKWKVDVLDMDSNTVKEYLFDIVIMGTGLFHLPNLPSEFLNFEGPVIHTAKWDHSINLDDKTVAVIGSGATAVQLIPEIVNKVKRLISYQRNPAWIIPKWQFQYPGWMKWIFAKIPGFRWTYRSLIFLVNELNHTAFQRGTILSRIGNPIGHCLGKTQLRTKIRNVELRDSLEPREHFGCKRPCLSNNYYSVLSLPQVSVVTSKVLCITEDSIVTENGNVEPIDVIILATGFKVQEYFAPMEIYGENSVDILNKWKTNGPSGFLGTAFSSMPNLFTLHGPGSEVGHNTGIFIFECQMKMVIKLLEEMIKRKTKRICVKPSSEEEYMEMHREKVKKTVWGKSDCQSFFSDSRGVVTLLYPETLISFWWDTRHVDPSKVFHFG